MKLNILKVLVALFLIAGAVYSQNTGKVKAVVGDLPAQMNEGESIRVAVTLTNTGTNTWPSDALTTRVTGAFSIRRDGNNEFMLEPGQSQVMYYLLTAPNKTGKRNCHVNFYTSNKKIGSKHKVIAVNGISPGLK